MKKTLIVYATRRGATRECAHHIHTGMGSVAEVFDLGSRNRLPDIAGFDRIIIGANAFSGKLNGRARSFVRRHAGTLLQKEIHLFMCSGESAQARIDELCMASYPEELVRKSLSRISFGSRVSLEDEGWLMRKILKRMGKGNCNTLDMGRAADWAKSLQGDVRNG